MLQLKPDIYLTVEPVPQTETHTLAVPIDTTRPPLLPSEERFQDIELEVIEAPALHVVTKVVEPILNEIIEKQSLPLPVLEQEVKVKVKVTKNPVIPEKLSHIDLPEPLVRPEPFHTDTDMPVTTIDQPIRYIRSKPIEYEQPETETESVPQAIELRVPHLLDEIVDKQVEGLNTEVDPDLTEIVLTNDSEGFDWVELAIHDILGEKIETSDIFAETAIAEIPEYIPMIFQDTQEEMIKQAEQSDQVKEQLAEYLEPLESNEVEAVVELVAVITRTVSTLLEHLEPEDLGSVVEKPYFLEIQETCIELLETLGLAVDEEQVKLFICLILQDRLSTINSIQSLPLLREEGTHEHKQLTTILSTLARLINPRPKLGLHNLVGRLALRFRIQVPSPQLLSPRSAALAAG